jgi:hypothetical protein
MTTESSGFIGACSFDQDRFHGGDGAVDVGFVMA